MQRLQLNSVAPYVGVETYVRVAASVAYMVHNLTPEQQVYELSDEQYDAACLFLASAVDLMRRPRGYDTWLTGETELVRCLRTLVPQLSGKLQPKKKLRGAWKRLLDSGVLRERGIDEGIDAALEMDARIDAAAEADHAAGRLQQCALAGCEARESHASHFKKCGACKTVSYCCREHQVEAWPSHKAACKAAREAAAVPAGLPSGA